MNLSQPHQSNSCLKQIEPIHRVNHNRSSIHTKDDYDVPLVLQRCTHGNKQQFTNYFVVSQEIQLFLNENYIMINE